MSYVVMIEVGKGKNRAYTQSVPLPNRERVCRYIKRSPLVRSNTKIKVKNLRTKKVMVGDQYRFCSRKDF